MDNVLKELSPHIFWNCDASILDYRKNKKIIIERIIKYGLENDFIIMWKAYSYRNIKKTAINIDTLDHDRILYLCTMLNTKPEDFKCYKNKQFQRNY